MAIDSSEQGSPGWWLQVLRRKLDARAVGTPGWATSFTRKPESRPGLQLLQDWYRGDPPLPSVAPGWQKGFREFLRMSRMNYAQLVVEPTRHRLRPLGWRTAVAGDENGDALALRVARGNDFGVAFSDTAKDMLSLRVGYMIVGEPQADLGNVPLITSESPLTTITAHDSGTGRTVAALKVSIDEWTGGHAAHLFLPGHVHVARQGTRRGGWEWDEDASGPLPEGLEDVVPVVRFRNRDDVGEFEPHLDVLARINNTILDRVVVSKTQAFRQRAIKNLPDKDETGEDIDYSDMFAADPGALWRVPDGVDFWESAQTQLDPIRMAIKDDVEGLAAVTSTPLHTVTPDAASGSAAGAELLREEHAFKVDDRRDRAAGSLARVMALAFRVMGDRARADVSQIETVWQPAQKYSLVEKGQAAAQLWGKLPAEAIFTDVLQYPMDAVARLQAQRAGDLFFAQMSAATGGPGGSASGALVPAFSDGGPGGTT